MSDPKPKFYTSWFCPFAQRVWIALLEKGIDFEYIEVDPYQKTPEWLSVSPRGLVPVLVHQGKSVYESGICIEYIDEEWPENPILPKAPYQRAYERIWADHIAKKIVPPFYAMLLKKETELQENAKKEMLEQLLVLTKAMDPTGPYFAGSQVGLVDIMLAPFAIRFFILKHYRGFQVPSGDESPFARFNKWYIAIKERDSTGKTSASDEEYIGIYKRYTDDTGQSLVATAIRQGTALP